MKKLSFTLLLASLTMFVIGCDKPSDDKPSETASATAANSEDSHDHSAPHGGDLIDLGHGHQHHAELVEKHDTETLTIYILDGDLKELSIDAPTVSLTLTAGDQSGAFDMAAVTEGGSSEFSSGDESMMTLIDMKGVTGKLRVSIDGKPMSGSFTHHAHDHAAGHDDDKGHDDHDGHDH